MDAVEKANAERQRRWVKDRKVGEGTYAVVYQGMQTFVNRREASTGRKVAIKKIKVGQFKDGLDMSAIREVKYLRELKHQNVIELLDVFSSKTNLNLVLEFLDSDLEMIIKDRSLVFLPADIKSWMAMTFRGLEFCHRNFILHRDLKPNNLLIASNGELKIADFGLARDFADPGHKMTCQVITRWYRPPELLFGSRYYSSAVDIWSVGCIFAELMLRIPYLPGESDMDQLKTIFRALGTPTEEEWPGHTKLPDYVPVGQFPKPPLRDLFTAASADTLNLLSKCLIYEPRKRITAREALHHPYFFALPNPTFPSKLPKCSTQLAARPLDEVDGNVELNTTGPGVKARNATLKRKLTSPDSGESKGRSIARRLFARMAAVQDGTVPSSTTVNKSAHPFDKVRLDALLNRRFFYAPAFEIYGGVAGLYDYGPPGSSLQANIIAEWRKHFIIEENMLEVDTTIMTPAPVFETSGHVARFADWMVKDVKTGDVLRADHLVKNVLEARLAGDKEARGLAAAPPTDDKKKKKKAVKTAAVALSDEVVAEYENILAQLDNYSGPEIGQLCKKHNIRNPDTDNEVGEPQLFNLMFASSIGPTGQHPGFLRPETAQGHFLNFSRLLEFNNGRLPFASAQIGRSFRNEISPRAGLLRVREFTMAEIEHYVDPEDKRHERFNEVRDVKLSLLDRHVQEAGKSTITEMTVGEAVDKGIIANETLGYFVARIYLFLVKIGINPQRLRFRQHMANEMAHYATDCWDAEIHNSTGWTECVGCADRAAYDLTVHSNKTGHPLVVRQALKEPIVTEKEVPEWNKKTLGKTFKQDAGVIQKIVESMEEDQLVKLKGQLAQGKAVVASPEGKEFEITPEVLTIERKTIKQSIREYTPNVIEPSFGLGRILYTLLEHSFWSREQDVERGVLSLPPVVAPTKVLVVPLSAREEFDPLVKEVSSKLRRAGVFSRVDDSNTSIGKRYARNDELGTPFGVTLDFASVQNRTMTLRERDTTDQRIGPIDEVIAVVTELVFGNITWEEACQRLPAYDGVQAVDS